MAVLEVRDLEVSFGPTRILRGVNLDLEAGKTLGVVGESGCGKSMTGFAIMSMLPGIGKVTGGSIKLAGVELTTLPKSQWYDVRGGQIALVMQDPFTSLNPMMRVGDQIAEAYVLHQKLSWDQGRKRAIEMLEKVGVPHPESSALKFPHQMSGGQRQRVVIAIAFACKPKVLIADEPTTALDVTLQAQILRLLKELQDVDGTAVMLVSHDIGVIGAISHRISVFYAGQVIENGTAQQVLKTPKHPYTHALLSALPRVGQTELTSIQGAPPDLSKLEPGCSFAPRCPDRFGPCSNEPPMEGLGDGHSVRCWKFVPNAATKAENLLQPGSE